MIRYIPIILLIPSLAYGACDCGSTGQANPCEGQAINVTVTATTADSVDSVFGWAFNSNSGDARCGQFANGDYWIAPADGETDVTITAITGSDSITADADPVMESMGLLSGVNNYGNYNASENVVPNLPITYTSVTSILAAIQRDEGATSPCGTSAILGECADAYNVVTILASVPDNAGSTVLRPNMTGESKVMLNLSDFDFTRLPEKSYLTGTTVADYEEIRQKWSHNTEIFGVHYDVSSGYSEGGRAFRAATIVDDYGASVSVDFTNDLMKLFSDDDPLVEKQAALAAMLTYGLDLYHDVQNQPVDTTRYWGQGATQSAGKYMPAVLMASLLTDTTYSTVLKGVGVGVGSTGTDIGPHELGQVNEGNIRPVWGDRGTLSGTSYNGAYWGALINGRCYDGAIGTCVTAQGSKVQKDPHGYIDGPQARPGVEYMATSLGPQRAFLAVMYMIPEVCETVNYSRLNTYVLELEGYGLHTADDPCVTPDTREDLDVCTPYTNSDCVYYGVTWGPVDPTDEDSDCIKVATPPYTKVGRFTELDGDPVSIGYPTTQVEANWDAIVAEGICTVRTGSTQQGTGQFQTGTGSLTTQ